MKRKRGRKTNHKKVVKVNVLNELPKSLAREDSEISADDAMDPADDAMDQADDAIEQADDAMEQADDAMEQADDPRAQPISEVSAEQAPAEPEKPSTAPVSTLDISFNRPPPKAVYGRVRVKLKAKGLENQQSSLGAQAPSVADKPNQQGTEELSEVAVNKDSGYSDGQTSDSKASDADKMPRKVGSIKIKSSKALVSLGDAVKDKNADKQEKDPVQIDMAKPAFSGNKGSGDLIVPANSPGTNGDQPRQDPHLNEEELTTALEVIKKVMKMEAAEPFNTPVDPVALGIPDYFDVVDYPMDFGTILHDLENGRKYLNSEDVLKDVQFIWDNCSKYNNKGDYILDLMKRVKKSFTKYWLAAGLYYDELDNGGTDNINIGDGMPTSQEKVHSKGKFKQKRRSHGVGRHKDDCLCAVCVVTRRRKEREQKSAFYENQVIMVDENLPEQKHEENSPVEQPCKLDAFSGGEQSPQTDTCDEMEEDEKEKKVEIPEQLKVSRSMKPGITVDRMEVLGKCINNQPSDLLPFDNGDEDFSQNSEEENDEDKADYKVSDKHKENTSIQHHQVEASNEKDEVIEKQDNPMLQENRSVLQICSSLFPNDCNSIWRGPRSLFRRPVSMRESPLHAAIATLMKR